MIEFARYFNGLHFTRVETLPRVKSGDSRSWAVIEGVFSLGYGNRLLYSLLVCGNFCCGCAPHAWTGCVTQAESSKEKFY